MWFPDRLIRVTCTPITEDGQPGVDLTARIVLKANLTDFSPEQVSSGINYLSLSHSWGPPPDPSAPIGGRGDTVLTESKLSAWQQDIPLDDLPLTFQHAVTVCAALGFEHIWIDSLCILQDSRADWQTQSAVMGDVYKFAWLNIAAMSSISDYDGFITEFRDPRVEFGFRAPFASILGRQEQECNSDDQRCILLPGKAKLLWNFASDIPATTSLNAPLFTRGWVFQERSLARRTLGFVKNTVYWACDEYSRGERPDWAHGGLASEGLRGTLHGVLETAGKVASDGVASNVPLTRMTLSHQHARDLLDAVDTRWFLAVTSYTLCNLTQPTDKLIAISSVARELSHTRIMPARYLAGLWDANIPFQLGWLNVNGARTPRRKCMGEAGYVAPSWSWASVQAPVQPCFIFNLSGDTVALADVTAADVRLETDFAFGSVTAGWLRMRGRLNRVSAASTAPFYKWDKNSKSTSLTDEATGETLWFAADTVEGREIVASRARLKGVVWMPLTLRFGHRMLDAKCLVLAEMPSGGSGSGSHGNFVRSGEKVYQRIGTGNFGRVPSMLRKDRLLLGLGTYPDIDTNDEQGMKLAGGFKRSGDGLEEFVLV